MEPSATGVAASRAGLLGNPSDIYGGEAIAFTFTNFEAKVQIEPGPQLAIDPGGPHAVQAPSLRSLPQPPRHPHVEGAAPLLQAACRRFLYDVPQLEAIAQSDPRWGLRLGYTTTIPRQVGLAGSSALILATLRALARWFEFELAPATLASLALAAEVEDLGITAGPMDRVVQAREGLLHMDFGPNPGPPESLDPACLPPLLIAWDPRGGEASGRVHLDVRQRWLDGDPAVREALARLPGLVAKGLVCLKRGDFEGLRLLVDENFDTRARIFAIAQRDRQLIEIARGLGAAAKFCGSGGSALVVPCDPADIPHLEASYREAGFQSLVPSIASPQGDPQ